MTTSHLTRSLSRRRIWGDSHFSGHVSNKDQFPFSFCCALSMGSSWTTLLLVPPQGKQILWLLGLSGSCKHSAKPTGNWGKFKLLYIKTMVVGWGGGLHDPYSTEHRRKSWGESSQAAASCQPAWTHQVELLLLALKDILSTTGHVPGQLDRTLNPLTLPFLLAINALSAFWSPFQKPDNKSFLM
jgi:hypothetical protein